ncbi:alpha/beta fold hydrolase [Mycobacterium haemophilum]|uniref:alpha/beta fold hydrolase n=1 Tax=Mycobacterium haemophilum TaxID=29311 RepID=UPI00143B4D55|nr:alpha/beta fold hydrolase [Mycobacterium haemophilum]
MDGAWRTITWSHYEHQILIAGRELNYVDIGWLGPPVVLLHGHGSTWQYWLDVIALLCQRRRVIALDLPGFGASRAHPWRTVSMAGIVATIVEFLDRLDVAKCDLVGHSMGSIFALGGRRRPESDSDSDPCGWSGVVDCVDVSASDPHCVTVPAACAHRDRGHDYRGFAAS